MRIYCYNRLHFVAPSFIILHTLKIFTASIINQLRIKSKSEWSKKSLLAWTTLRFTSFSLWDIVKDHYRCNKSSNGKCLLYVCNLFSLSLYMHTQVFLLTATANPYLSPPELTTWIIVMQFNFLFEFICCWNSCFLQIIFLSNSSRNGSWDREKIGPGFLLWSRNTSW